jgi:hypothetical protein
LRSEGLNYFTTALGGCALAATGTWGQKRRLDGRLAISASPQQADV